MYEKHFNLRERPFRNVPDTKMFFDGGGRGDVLRALRYAVETGEGIVKVVGEVGSGKTMLCRKLDESLSDKVQIVFLANPSLEPEYILHAVAQELGLAVTLSTNRFNVQQVLQKYLLEQHELGKRVVVLIEEAQCMPPRTLEEIRLMSNLETEKQKLLQLVLFGQPELDVLLGRSDLRQFNERISHALYLKPFSLDDLKDYLNHRLQKSGYQGSDLFNIKVVKHIYKFANGSVRRINLLADKTLLAAYAFNDTEINIKHARSAAEDCKYIARVNAGFPFRFVIPAMLAAAIATPFWLNPSEQTEPIDINAVELEIIPDIDEQEIEKITLEEVRATIEVPVIEEKIEQIDVVMNVDAKNIVESHVAQENKFSDMVDQVPNEEGTMNMDQSSPVMLRVNATMDWVKTADQSQYTIQLMTAFVNEASELYELESILNSASDEEEIKDFLVFRGNASGQRVFVVCYKIYPGLTPARSAIGNLHPMLKRYKPFVRNVRSIMHDIGDENA